MDGYLVPAGTARVENVVVNSRFIATVGNAATVDEARAFVDAIRAEMPDATHHVYAFKVGFGSSVIEGMSDDGEPSGTAGPPVLTVVRGSGIGDVVVVVTRYFGGTKLGTGGLVRAYSGAARDVLAALTTVLKVSRVVVGVEFDYSFFEQVKRLLPDYDAEIVDQDFSNRVVIFVRLPEAVVDGLKDALFGLMAGRVVFSLFGDV